MTLNKTDQNFTPNTWNKLGAEFAAGPRLRDANPTGTGIVKWILFIPGELNFDAAKFVGVDVLRGWTNHCCR